MNWIKIKEGYVRQDAIVDAHITPYYPKTIFFLLTTGTSVKYADYESEEEAWEALEQITEELDKVES